MTLSPQFFIKNFKKYTRNSFSHGLSLIVWVISPSIPTHRQTLLNGHIFHRVASPLPRKVLFRRHCPSVTTYFPQAIDKQIVYCVFNIKKALTQQHSILSAHRKVNFDIPGFFAEVPPTMPYEMGGFKTP